VHARSFILALIAPILGSADASTSRVTAEQCARLAGNAHPGLKVLSATMVPAGYFTVAGSSLKVPRSCRISGVARPSTSARIGFELWLPDDWNGRYSQLGNGGFAGNIDETALANEIRRGNAAAMTDTGHKAGQFDASWAYGHPERIVDYGYRSIKVTADAARSLIHEYYGQRARRRYFVGCSNGGRQALMAAQRYPQDWDGILAGSPAIEWTKQLATFAAIQQHLRASPENWIPTAKLAAIQSAAIAQCQPNGKGGEFPASRPCRIEVKRLLCRRVDGPACLTRPQAASLELIQSGPENARAGQYYFGFEPTAAALPDNWDHWILNPDRNAQSQLAFATQAYRYLILDRPDWQVEDFNRSRDFQRASERKIGSRSLSRILDPENPDLSRFARRGGKLIMYVGLSDAVISPAASIAYYRAAAKHAGSMKKVRTFARLFVVPGMQHCQGGLAPNAFGQAGIAPALRADPFHDIRLALETWVEQGRAPDSIVAAKYENDRPAGRVISTQEIPAFPKVAREISAAQQNFEMPHDPVKSSVSSRSVVQPKAAKTGPVIGNGRP
jgi:feruloyl esterase